MTAPNVAREWRSRSTSIGKTTPSGVRLDSDEAVVNALLDEKGVATVHGRAFGLGPYFRIAYALDDESLLRACTAIRDFCRTLTN